MYKNIPKKRYDKTLKMLKDICQPGSVIYDLGVENPFSKIMQENNYKVYNSEGQDFDIDFKINIPKDVDLVTGFEILEHLVSPFPLLKSLEAKKLFVTVPLNLWFSKAYRSKIDNRDRHFHEFEEWQFDWLLEKAGWKILKKEKWTNPSFKIGLRPILRNFHNRYYAVYAERIDFGRWPEKNEHTNYYRGVLNL